jgi:hypothetical protein
MLLQIRNLFYNSFLLESYTETPVKFNDKQFNV